MRNQLYLVADYNLGVLEKNGCIRRHREVSRGIELLDSSFSKSPKAMVPVIGQIAAGVPIPVPSAESWNTTAAADSWKSPGFGPG